MKRGEPPITQSCGELEACRLNRSVVLSSRWYRDWSFTGWILYWITISCGLVKRLFSSHCIIVFEFPGSDQVWMSRVLTRRLLVWQLRVVVCAVSKRHGNSMKRQRLVSSRLYKMSKISMTLSRIGDEYELGVRSVTRSDNWSDEMKFASWTERVNRRETPGVARSRYVMDRSDAPVQDGSATETSPKSKQKKKSLCRMLMNKKTRVGCLEVSYRDRGSGEGDSNKNSKTQLSHYGSNTSTKLSLCCAMTERSRTPPQSLTVSRLSPATLSCASVKSELAYAANSNCQVQAYVEKTRNSIADDAEYSHKNGACAPRESAHTAYADGKNKCLIVRFA